MDKRPELVEGGDAVEQLGLVHRVLLPQGDGPHPTVVMVHGRKGTEDVMWIFARTIPKDWLMISVRALFEEEEGYSWHPPLGRLPVLGEMETAVSALHQFITNLPTVYSSAPSQTYLMGFSQGTAVSLATAIKHTNLVQGIAGLVGFLPETDPAVLATAPLKDLPVFLAVGEKDDTIPLDLARQSGEAVRAAGAWLEYREYPTGHKLNGAGMRKLTSWWEEISEQ